MGQSGSPHPLVGTGADKQDIFDLKSYRVVHF